MLSKACKMLFILLAGVFLGSCQGKDAPVEIISVEPGFQEVEAGQSFVDLTVKANARWTLTMDQTWLEPGRTSGNGDATVSVHVFENKSTEPREAVLTFTTAGGAKATFTLSQKGKEGVEPEGTVLRLGTYNLRMHQLDKEGDNAWDVRKGRLKSSILACDFDVFGIQEVSSVMQTWLNSELTSRYAFKYFSPYSQNGNGDRAQGIAYKKDAFTLSEWHFFWASDTPDTMTENDTGSEGNFKRGGCCCVLTHKASGKKIFFMNNHGCLNAESNKAHASAYVTQEKRFNAAGLPSFFVGDMNARESAEAGSVYMTYTAWWQDPFKVIPSASRQGPAATYNGYASPNGRYRLDYVFFRGEGVTPRFYCCDNTLYGGLYASDHFPVWVEYSIQ